MRVVDVGRSSTEHRLLGERGIVSVNDERAGQRSVSASLSQTTATAPLGHKYITLDSIFFFSPQQRQQHVMHGILAARSERRPTFRRRRGGGGARLLRGVSGARRLSRSMGERSEISSWILRVSAAGSLVSWVSERSE